MGNLNVTINPLPVEVQWTLTGWTDGDTPTHEYTGTNLLSTVSTSNTLCGDDKLGVSVTAPVNGTLKNAGDYTLTASVTEGNADNYELTGNTKPVKITQKEVTVTWSGFDNFTYNGTSQVPTLTVTNEATGENKVVTYTKSTAPETVINDAANVKAAGVYTASLVIGGNNGNYKLAEGSHQFTQVFTIKQLPVVLQWKDKSTEGGVVVDLSNPAAYVYDGQDHAPVATVNNLVAGDTVNVTLTEGDAKKDVNGYGSGTYDDTVTYTATAYSLSNPNYTLTGGTNPTQTFKITPKPVPLTWTGNEPAFELDDEKLQHATAVVDGDFISLFFSHFY